MTRHWLGIDIGGTFTDFACFDTRTGQLIGLKVPSTPPDFAEAVRIGLQRLADEHGVNPAEIGTVVHGTTIAVNTLIQRTGARLGLLVTEGFRDVLELQRLQLPNPFDLDGGRFLGGRMPLDRALAKDALARFAGPLGMTPDAAAESVVRVAVSTMYAEFTKILSRAAVDPRNFALVAFGGAGPGVGALVAREVGLPTVFVPRSPGTLCALGAISADVVNDAVRTVHARLEVAPLQVLRASYDALRTELADWLDRHGADAGPATFHPTADMRYVGQSYEIEVPVEPAWLAAGGGEAIRAAFHRAHERAFGHADREAPAEIVNLRVQLRAARPPVPLAEVAAGGTPPGPRATRRIWLDGRRVEACIYDRAALGRDARIVGPAIVEQPDTTVLVPADHAGDVDRFGNLVIRREG